MKESTELVSTIEITYAVRDTKLDGVEIHKDDIMAIGDRGILAVGSSIQDVAIEALSKVVTDESELISVYNGAEFGEADLESLTDAIGENYPDLDLEAAYGGQPIYYLILSVE